MRHSWWASYFAREKKRFFSRARDTRARSQGFALFCFHNLHTRVLKRGIFSTEKKEKVTFTATHYLQTAANFQKRGKKLIKRPTFFRKRRRKKEKRWTFFKKTPTFFGPSRWRLWKQKVQNARDARAWKGHWWKTKTLRNNCCKRIVICETNLPKVKIDGFAHPCASAQVEENSPSNATQTCKCFGTLSKRTAENHTFGKYI